MSRPYLAEYGATRSRKDFTQRQLMTCLILRSYLRTTYRGALETLAGNASLRACLGMQEKLPHFTTLQKFSARSQVAAIVQKIIARVGQAAMAAGGNQQAAAMDSTGLDTTSPSAYYESRRGRRHRSYVKLSTIVLCGSLFPLAVVLDRGPSNDRVQVPALLDQAQAVGQPTQLLADAGYDAEWIHARCREQWGVESLIVPNGQRADGQRNGRWRALMSTEHMRQRGYGKRWAVESFFSAFKRTMGWALSTRKPETQLAEAAIRMVAFVLRR
ncbi:MAG TPA: IS5 family transposase [Verrucomicrobiae bacterium]|nr:IS5 family transposase [Verrucomicrobiae bacterium]